MNVRKALYFVVILVLGVSPSASRGQASPSRNVKDDAPRVTLRGNTHPLAVSTYDRGLAPDALPMESMLLVLQRPADKQSQLDELLRQQQDKSSPEFHKWLSPQEFGLRFGPSDADMASVTSWLAGNGFGIKRVTPGRTVVEFSGTAAQIKNAFHTEIHSYAVQGEAHWANNRDPQIPASLASVVSGIVSLNDFSKTPPNTNVQSFVSSSPGGKPKPTPFTTLAGAGCTPSQNCYGVGPADFATIYDVSPLYTAGIDGTGQTIAIASSSNISLRDVQNFRKMFNLPVNDPQITVIGPDPGLVSGKEGPATLQVQWAGAVAPKATIQLLVTQSTTSSEGANLSAITAINNNLAPILTLSFEACEPAIGAGGAAFYTFLWEQAAAQGMTVIAPAGDSGAAACDSRFTEIAASHGIAVNAVASTPFNVAVGGTDFDQVGNWAQYWNASNDPNTLASAKSYIPEVAWNDTCAENGPNGCAQPNQSGSDLIAGAGGYSIFNAIPIWQITPTGVNPNGGRVLPDISLFSGDGNNGSFYIYCQGDANGNGDPTCNLNPPYLNIQVGGGTASSAAAFAGIMALVDQYNKGPQGNANFVLYPFAQNSAAGAFHDVTKGDTSVACVGGSFQTCSSPGPGYGIISDVNGAIWSASPGYDLATGLGSVDANNLVTKWSSVSFKPTTTTIVSVTPANSAHGQAVSFAINVTSPSGTPTGDVAIMINPNPPPAPLLAPDAFTLVNGSVSGASGTTTKLPGGTYQVFAHYAGDGTFAPSDSTPVTVTVAQQQSQTTLSIEDISGGPLACFDSGQSEQFGAVYYLRVVIDNPGDFQDGSTNCFPVISHASSPTGTVTIQDVNQGTNLGITLNYALNGRGVIEIPQFPAGAGQHQITATYSGDSSYAPSSAGTGGPPTPFFFVIITKGLSRVTLSANPTLILAGTNVAVTADVSNLLRGSTVPPPSGKVTFLSDDGKVLGTATLGPNPNPNGFSDSLATINIAPTQPVTISAKYDGDVNYNASSSQGSVSIAIGTADFSISNPAGSVSVVAGKSGSTTISIAPILGFTGAVALACPDASTLPPGMTCAISPTTVTPATNGKPVTATVTLTSQAPSIILASIRPPSREWMAVAGGSLGIAAVLLLGAWRRNQYLVLSCSVLVAVLFCGSCAGIVTAPTPDSTLTLTTSSVKSPAGSAVSLGASVSADHTVQGTVDFFDNGNQIAQGVPLQTGRASYDTTSLVLGTHPITATYSGDGHTHPASQKTPLEQVITGTSQLKITATSGPLKHDLQLQFTLK